MNTQIESKFDQSTTSEVAANDGNIPQHEEHTAEFKFGEDAHNSRSSNIKQTIRALQSKAENRNQVLVEILSSAYSLYREVEGSGETQKSQHNVAIEELLEEMDVDTKSTKTHTRIVRLIFDKSDMDRKQVSTYGMVLKNAFDGEVPATSFEEWIKSVGGIANASRINSTKKSDESLLEALADIDLIEQVTVVSDSNISNHITKCDFDFKLAFCKWDSATGQLTIYKLIENEAKVKSAFRPYVKEVTKISDALADQARADSKIRRRNQVVSEAATELV